MSENIVKNRREYLFLYDVKYANPNGDPNDENRPRIDEETQINIVTDVRLKRTIRDYLLNYENKEIFIREIFNKNGKLQEAKDRAANFGKNPEKILAECIDIRLFGATIPLEKKSNSGKSITFTGPIQFNIGQSLHKVKLMHIKGTGAFASGENKEQKTFREDWVLPYSLIAFHAILNEQAAVDTKLTDEDVEYFKKAMWEGTKNLITRSKTEQLPRLLIEVIFKEGVCTHIGELHKYVKIESELEDEEIRSTEDFVLNVDELIDVLEEYADKIEKVTFKVDRKLKLNKPLASDEVKFEKIEF
ncbi:CRISPR-associated protein, Csh2 family (plasmid) [Deferribacter desulfuricans SSM1]|uniref:CRISPR-associated protein, Csh2 family n=1 Tax=Deferribacter desulfuricans (strain DSM 14783 / JCM 11476 / NBRC 101012 / SSM1) TaxID=639282 RepID=D3PEQ2_DEFDS|nr:type I-B CRISPR-associated protein Cas7/Csh2 [Deferribacter desulfuricans]BAI81694.1 CRISPR-associated protein, Csh2 family [Deferribacter desulfuricans SSM1]